MSDRERLLIKWTWAVRANDPSQRAIGDTMVVRYPGEPDAEYAAGAALAASGDFLGAARHLRQIIAADSQSLHGKLRCLACDAYHGLVAAYVAADSMPAAERVAREWTRASAGAPAPWGLLGWVLGREHRYATEQQQRAHPDREQSRGRRDGPEQAEQHQSCGHAERRQSRVGAQARKPCGRQHRSLADGRNRRHPRRAQRWA